MRILLVQLSAGFAGTERHAIELANALAAEHEVGVLVRARPAEPHRQAQYDAMRWAIAPKVRVFTAPRALPGPALWLALLRFRPDVVHAHHERSARVAGRWSFGAPVLATVHAHWSERDFRRCDGLVCLTEEQAAEVRADYARPCFVVGNWVMPAPPRQEKKLAALRAEFGLPPSGAFVVGTACRLDPGKGVEGLLAAFRAAGLPKSHLVVAGEGSERPALEAAGRRLDLDNRVVFAGFRADMRELYGLFDLFVLNSSTEAYGLVILEAAAAGVPVIATATRGARAIAERHPIELVPIGDVDALTAALRSAFARRRKPAPSLLGFALADRLPHILAAYRRLLEDRSSSHRNRRLPIEQRAWRIARGGRPR